MIQMFIGNEEVVCQNQITISEEILTTSSTTLNNCYPKSWENDKNYTSRYYYPKDYSKFKILRDNNLIFCGVVKNTGNINLNPRYPHFCSLQILDFKALLSEGDTLDFVIANKTVTEAIEMVVDKVKEYGFIVGNIQIEGANDVIGAYSTLNKTAYDVFQYLADITQSKWFTRTIDENTVAIDFYDPVLMTKAGNIEFTEEYFETNKICDMKFSYGTYDYRNKQIMLSDEVYADIDYTENITADGFSKSFDVSTKIGIVKSISVNGVQKTIATKEDKEIGIEADFYWSADNTQIETDILYSSGSIIQVVYTPLVKGRQIVINEDEITRIATQTNRKGTISRYESRNDVLSSAELNKIGQSYLRYKGIPEITLTIETEDIQLFDVGEVVYFNAPLNELKQDYLVKKKQTKMFVSGEQNKIFYTYELSSSFNGENEINYFDNQRNKATGNISTGEYIDRNIDIENQALIIFKDVEIQEIQPQSTNALQSVLGAPFIK